MKISNDFLNKYNVSGPRYTSYPPANFFHADYSVADYIETLKATNTQSPQNISLYIHIPFCPRRCHFCGCSTVIAQRKSMVERYVEALKQEIRNVASHLDLSRPVTQIHWGGGTPNSISMELIRDIMEQIRSLFILADHAEIAMECSPAYLEFRHIDQLAEMGFNRVSLGIQDFRDDVLEAVNRQPSRHPVKALVDYFRSKGFRGINLDFIYGLPLQTKESFAETLKQAIAIRPDRIVTFSYAHVPWVKSAQKQLEKIGLPTPEEKMEMLVQSIAQLEQAGYISIGIDHFVLPDDDLAIAFQTKKLHRNFQGYCTLATTGQVYGFGSSSIGQFWGAYAQNKKNFPQYIEAIEQTGYAIERGYQMTQDQQIIRAVINSIMCNGVLHFDALGSELGVSGDRIRTLTRFDPAKFEALIADQLMTLNDGIIRITDQGFMFARNIAMQLDPAYNPEENLYSKTV